MIELDRKLTGSEVKLFRLWLYAPFPGGFLLLAGLFLFDPQIDRIGLGFVFAFLVLAYMAYVLVRQIERKFGHANLRILPTRVSFIITVIVALAWPLAFHVMYLVGPREPTRPEDLHWHMSFLIAGTVPLTLLGIKWHNSGAKSSTIVNDLER